MKGSIHNGIRQARSRGELVQPRGLRLGFYQRKPPRAAPVKSYPQLKGWAPGREMGLRLHNRARYMLHGQSDDAIDRHVIQKIREQRRRSNTGVTVGDLWSESLDNPPTEAHLSGFCFNTNNNNSNFPKRQIVFTIETFPPDFARDRPGRSFEHRVVPSRTGRLSNGPRRRCNAIEMSS